MKLLVPSEIAVRIRAELRLAGRTEVGGLLMGEHVAENTFRVVDLTVQRSGASHSEFVRDPGVHGPELAAFFERTGRNYARFNYLGEWHSHPGFPPRPSLSDIAEMVRLVDDPEVGVSFAILMIVRLRFFGRLIGSATIFPRAQTPMSVILVWERETASVGLRTRISSTTSGEVSA